MNKTIDFTFIEEECKKYYSILGRKGENPVVLFKMLLLANRFDLSERHIEEHCNYNMLFKHFLGLEAVNGFPNISHCPDSATGSGWKVSPLSSTG